MVDEATFKSWIGKMSEEDIQKRIQSLVNGDRRQDRPEWDLWGKETDRVLNFDMTPVMEKRIDQIGIRCTNTGGGSLNTFGRVEYLVEYCMLLEKKLSAQ